MAGLQLSGLASGFDWKSVVDQLIEVGRSPQQRLRTTKATNLNKLTAFSSLRSRVTALQDAAKALSSDALFGQRSTAFSTSDVTWSASASSRAVTGDYKFNVTQVATRSERAGEVARSDSLHSSGDVSGLVIANLRLAVGVSDGAFTVNGARVEVDDADTLDVVFDRISDATGGAVTAAYDPLTDRVTLTGAGPITLGSGADTSNFLYAFKLYNSNDPTTTISSAAQLGTLQLSDSIAGAGLASSITAVDGSGNGSFTINGTTIDYNVNNDSLQQIIGRVNESAAGATLSYDVANDSFRLVNKNTGDVGLGVTESSGGLLAALGIADDATVTRGKNAEFSVNDGGTIVSATNVLDEAAHGFAGLTVTANSVDEHTVTVKSDSKGIEKGIRTFIEKYNEVQKLIDEQTKVTVGVDGKVTAAQFANNRELSDMARQLRGMVFGQVSGVSGAFTRLESLGIDFNAASSQLAVRDEAKFSAALTNNLSDVAALFTTPTTGLTAKLAEYAGRLTNTSGAIDTQENTLERQNSQLDTQIADLERRLEAERTRLEASFIRMEEAQQLMNTQLAALQRTFNFQ